MRSTLVAGAICAALTGPAHALGTSSLPADVTVVISGAAGLVSNFDAVLGIPPAGLIAGDQVCMPGTTTKFVDPGSGSNMIAWFCNAGPGTGLPSTRKILIYFRGAGGSPMGVDPVGQYSIGFYRISAAGCGAGSGLQTIVCASWNNNVASADYYTAVPDAGFSLIEPALLTAPSSNVPLPGQCINSFFIDPCPQGLGTPGVGSSAPILAQGTILAVNASMRAMLAGMQGLTLTQVPSLTRAEARSIFTEGNLLSNGPAAPNWSFLSNALKLRFPAGTGFSGQMTLCRGINGLGTAATFNSSMLAAPCSTGAPAGSLPFVATSKPPNLTVNILPTVAQVLACLQNATTPAFGMLTIDQLARATQAGVSFVNIDGQPMTDSATLNDAAIQTGIYEVWSETFLQISNALVSGGGDKFAVLDAFQLALQTTTPGLGVYNIQGLGTSKPMFVTRGGNSCSPPLY